MFRTQLVVVCLGIASLWTSTPVSADDAPAATNDVDRELRERDALRRIRDAPGISTPERAEEILRARNLVREMQDRERLRVELEKIGVSESPLTGTPPTDEQLAQLRALAARIRGQVGASVQLDAIDDYLDLVEERLANQFLGEIDVYRRPRNFSPEELETLAAAEEKYPRTTVARRARLVREELALEREFESLKIEVDPESEVGRVLDQAARAQLVVARQLVPRQRLQRLRDLSEVFAGTPTAKLIERELDSTKRQIDETRERHRARDEAAAARSVDLRAYWDPRYGRASRGN